MIKIDYLNVSANLGFSQLKPKSSDIKRKN